MQPLFVCPKCGGHYLDEVRVDTVVISEIILFDEDDSGEYSYGEQRNEDGEIDHYECRYCDYKIEEDTPEGLISFLRGLAKKGV
jgi:DNA-directed RNA polymerase subunit RPC12/RpoP